MNSHRIKVLDRADDHAVVCLIPHHFHFKFLPTQKRLFNEDFGDRREIKAALGEFLKFLTVVCNTSSGATQGKRRAANHRKSPDPFRDAARLLKRMSGAADRNIQSDLLHEILEGAAIFSSVD